MIRTVNNQLHTYDIMYLTGEPKDKDRKAFTVGYIATEKPLDFGKDSEKGLVCNAVAEQWKSDFGTHVRIFPHINGYNDGDGIMLFADFVRNAYYKYMLRNDRMVKSYYAMQWAEKEEHLSIAYTAICEAMANGENNPYILYKTGKAAIERFRYEQKSYSGVKYSPDWGAHNPFEFKQPVNNRLETLIRTAVNNTDFTKREKQCILWDLQGWTYKDICNQDIAIAEKTYYRNRKNARTKLCATLKDMVITYETLTNELYRHFLCYDNLLQTLASKS